MISTKNRGFCPLVSTETTRMLPCGSPGFWFSSRPWICSGVILLRYPGPPKTNLRSTSGPSTKLTSPRTARSSRILSAVSWSGPVSRMEPLGSSRLSVMNTGRVVELDARAARVTAMYSIRERRCSSVAVSASPIRRYTWCGSLLALSLFNHDTLVGFSPSTFVTNLISPRSISFQS